MGIPPMRRPPWRAVTAGTAVVLTGETPVLRQKEQRMKMRTNGQIAMLATIIGLSLASTCLGGALQTQSARLSGDVSFG